MKSSIRIAAILSAFTLLTCGYSAVAQTFPRERSLLGIPMGASSLQVLAKFGQPNHVESADTQKYLGGGAGAMGSPQTGAMMGSPYGMSGASSPYGMAGPSSSPYGGMPGGPAGNPMMMGMGGPGGPMGAAGPARPTSIILRPPYSTGGGGMGGLPGMMGGFGGSGSPYGGPGGGPPSYMRAGGSGPSSPYSGMGGSGPSSPYSGSGSPYGGSGPTSPYGGSGSPYGGPGGGMMPPYGGMSPYGGGSAFGGKSAGGTNSQNLKMQYQNDILNAEATVLNSPPVDLDQGEVKWIYNKGTNEKIFLFDHAGEVIQIQSLGYANGGATSGGVHLGSTQKQIMEVYGFTDKIYNTTSTDAYGKKVSVMTLDYSQSSNCAFDLIDRHDGKGFRVVRITVALMHKADL